MSINSYIVLNITTPVQGKNGLKSYKTVGVKKQIPQVKWACCNELLVCTFHNSSRADRPNKAINLLAYTVYGIRNFLCMHTFNLEPNMLAVSLIISSSNS